MATKSFELRELFHLAFLRHLSMRLSGRSYAVKGGICLRLFHRSPRLSEDMDLDIVSQVRVETLRKAVDSVVEGRAMLAELMPAGVTAITVSRPKQTETTQRWKIALRMAGGQSLPTKVEFSRRRDRIEHSTGVPDAALLRQYAMPPFAARHYDAPRMAAQKIAALAAPARNALRDLFDLHHLFSTIGVGPEKILPLIESGAAAAAGEKTLAFSFSDFKEQVLPYLTAELMDLYRDPSVFEMQKERTAAALAGMVQ